MQRLRFQQHGRRSPCLSFDRPTSMRRARVSSRPVERIQRIHSQRAIGVIFAQRSRVCWSALIAACQSFGTSGSGQSLVGSISRVTVSPAAMPAVLLRLSSTRNQWLQLPSGSSGVRNSCPFTVPCTITCPRDGSFALASFGSRRIVHEPMVNSLVLKRILDIPIFYRTGHLCSQHHSVQLPLVCVKYN